MELGEIQICFQIILDIQRVHMLLQASEEIAEVVVISSIVVVSSVIVVYSVVGVSVVSVSHKTHPAFAGQSHILPVGLKCNSDGQDLYN